MSRGYDYHSSFGGFWFDRLDGIDEIETRVSKKELSRQIGNQLTDLTREGVVVFSQAIAPERIEKFYEVVKPGIRSRLEKGRTINLRSEYPVASAVAFSEGLVDFLRSALDDGVAVFRDELFRASPESSVNQCSQNGGVAAPVETLSMWIGVGAKSNSVTLQYYPGSHRFPEFIFNHGEKVWIEDLHDENQRVAYQQHLKSNISKLSLHPSSITLNEGVCVFMHPDTVYSIQCNSGINEGALLYQYCGRIQSPIVKEGFYIEEEYRTPQLESECSTTVAGVELKNCLNKWTRVPKDCFGTPFQLHANSVSLPPIQCTFQSIYFNRACTLTMSAFLNVKNKHGLELSIGVQESDKRSDDWDISNHELSAGENAIKLIISEAGTVDFFFELKLPSNAESNNFCGVKFSSVICCYQ